MEKSIALIQLTDSKLKLIIGNIVDNKPILVYSTERPLRSTILRGNIKNFANLTEIIKSLTEIVDVDSKIRINLSDAIVLLPPIGFNVYQSNKTTNVVSSTNIIQPVDIINCVSMVQKEEIKDGDRIVDIVPDYYILSDNRTSILPPVGETTPFLSIQAKVQTLPEGLINTYEQPFVSAGMRIRNFVCEPYAIASLVKSKKGLPPSYLLVDIEDGLTSLTLVSNGSPIKSTYFEYGYNDLVEQIVNYFNVDYPEAENLINLYGINDRDLNFDPIIANVNDKKFTPDDLNEAINLFCKKYFLSMNASYNALVSGFFIGVKEAPVVFCGRLIDVNGFEKLLSDNFKEAKSKHFLRPDTIGARKSEYSALIGALLVSENNKGSLSEQQAQVAPISRMKDGKKAK